MSVYQRRRHVSEYEFFHKALEIRVEVNRLMVQESAVPKRYRLTNAVPTIETARSIVYNINRADSFYPSSPMNVIERRKYLTLAIADCEQLCLDMQCLLQLGLPGGASRFERMVELIDEEIGLLKGARKNVKLVGKRDLAQRIEDAEAELEMLRDLKMQQEADDVE